MQKYFIPFFFFFFTLEINKSHYLAGSGSFKKSYAEVYSMINDFSLRLILECSTSSKCYKALFYHNFTSSTFWIQSGLCYQFLFT